MFDYNEQFVTEYRCVDYEADYAEGEPGGGIVGSDDGKSRKRRVIERQTEHTEQRKGLSAVLQPNASFAEEFADGAGDYDGDACVHCAAGNCVVAIGNIPEVVSDNPEPKLIRPYHIFGFGFGDFNSHPTGKAEHKKKSCYRVKDIPGSAEHINTRSVHGGVAGIGNEYFDFFDDGFDYVDDENQHREVVSEFGLAYLVDIADEHKSDYADYRGISFQRAEPGLGRGAVGLSGKNENTEDYGQKSVKDGGYPFVFSGNFVEND